MHRFSVGILFLLAVVVAPPTRADVPLGGFIPYVGVGLTKEFKTYDDAPDGTFFIADKSLQWGGSPLGPGSSAFFDLAILDTGAATHILTQSAASASGYGIQAEGFRGTHFQTIFGASGTIDLRINDPLGVYVTGLSNRTAAGAMLTLNTATMRGQTSLATLEGGADWKLPNVIGLPMAAQHAISIRNDQPQIFQYQGRTVRTPNVNLIDLGAGAQQGVSRWTNMIMRPSASFLTGPLYIQSTEIGGGLDFNFHDNPLSPSVLDSGALFVETDMSDGSRSFQDKEFLFDTGADLTVVSKVTAARLGFDVVNDTPDFLLEVEGAGGVTPGVPGFYVDQLNIDTVGGSFTLQNVPVAIVDLPNPNDPGNILPGILGMHLFTGRNLVIDANPAAVQGSTGPRLYIGNPVYETHTWSLAGGGGGATWNSPGAWTGPGAPTLMWDAQAVNSSGTPQTASVEADSTVYRLTVAGAGAGTMTVQINNEKTLTTFGEALIKTGGVVRLNQGGKLDAQFVNLDGGSIVGTGEVFVGTGPLTGAVRNLSGRIAPDTLFSPIGLIEIGGDLANLGDGTLAFDLGGTGVGQYDVIEFDRNAYLGGTLEVTLANFTPVVGNTFNIITDGEAVYGTFDHLILPAGFQWLVDYQANQVVLKVTGLGSLPGDFDNNGSVNAQDLMAWKNGLGTTYTAQDFLVWQKAFGSGGMSSAVPEPVTWMLAFGGALSVAGARRKRRG